MSWPQKSNLYAVCVQIKFLFSRMSEPDAGPSWNHVAGAPWRTSSDNLQEPIWRAQWCGCSKSESLRISAVIGVIVIFVVILPASGPPRIDRNKFDNIHVCFIDSIGIGTLVAPTSLHGRQPR